MFSPTHSFGSDILYFKKRRQWGNVSLGEDIHKFLTSYVIFEYNNCFVWQKEIIAVSVHHVLRGHHSVANSVACRKRHWQLFNIDSDKIEYGEGSLVLPLQEGWGTGRGDCACGTCPGVQRSPRAAGLPNTFCPGVQPPCRPSITTQRVAVLGLFLRCSGWIRWSGQIPLLLSPSVRVTSPFSAGWMSRAGHGFYLRVEYRDGGLIKELDVQLRAFVVFTVYGNLLSPVLFVFPLPRLYSRCFSV